MKVTYPGAMVMLRKFLDLKWLVYHTRAEDGTKTEVNLTILILFLLWLVLCCGMGVF